MALVTRNRTESASRSAPASLRSEDATAVDHPQASAFAEPRRRGKAQEGLHRDRHIRRGWLVRRMLLAADVAGLLAAFFATELIFLGNRLVDNVGIGEETLIFVALLPAWVVAAKLYGLYDRDEERATHSTADEVVSVFHLITVGVWLFYATSWLVGLWRPDQAKLATFWLLALVVRGHGSVGGSGARTPASAYVQNTVDRRRGRGRAADRSQAPPASGVRDQPPRLHRCRPRKRCAATWRMCRLLGEPEDIGEIVRSSRRGPRDRGVLAGPARADARPRARHAKARRSDRPRAPAVRSGRAQASASTGSRACRCSALHPARISRSSRLLKRSFDIVGAWLLLALRAPLMAVIALLIRRDSSGPVFFRQTTARNGYARVHAAEVSDDARGNRRRTSPRVHEADHERRTRSPARTISTSSSDRTRSLASAAGCGRRASTSCRS